MDLTPQEPDHARGVEVIGNDGPFRVEAGRLRGADGDDHLVILKQLAPDWPCSASALEAFDWDARRLQGLVHPNLLRVLDVQRDGQGMRMTVEHVRAIPLSAILEQQASEPQRMSLGQAVRVFQKAAEGLKAAHTDLFGGTEVGLVHGALAPSRLLLTVDGDVKIKDFGIYRLALHPAGDQGLGLDPDFLSPEQDEGLAPDFRSDVFSLGKVFERLLIQSQEVHAGGAIPPELLELLHRCLEMQPQARFQTAGELVGVLDEILQCSQFEAARFPLEDLAWQVIRSAQETSSVSAVGDPPRTAEDGDLLLDPGSFWDAGAADDDPTEVDTRPPPTQQAPPLYEGPAPARAAEAQGEGAAPDIRSGEFLKRKRPPSPEPAEPSRNPGYPGDEEGAEGGDLWKRSAAVGGFALIVALASLFWTSPDPASFTTSAETSGESISAPDLPAAPVSTAVPVSTSVPGQALASVGPSQSQPRPVPIPLAPGPGEIKIISDPATAMVIVNEERRGVTPVVVRNLPLNTPFQVRLELDEHHPWIETFQLDSQSPSRELIAGLRLIETCAGDMGWLYVTSDPGGAIVELNDKRLPGKTPMIINQLCASTRYSLRVEALGFKPWRKEIGVMSRQVTNLNVELKR